MIIYDLNTVGITAIKAEANAPLVVDSDTPLAFAVTGKFFKVIRRWYSEEFEGSSGMDQGKFPVSSHLDIDRQFSREKAVKDPFRFLTSEGLYHGRY